MGCIEMTGVQNFIGRRLPRPASRRHRRGARPRFEEMAAVDEAPSSGEPWMAVHSPHGSPLVALRRLVVVWKMETFEPTSGYGLLVFLGWNLAACCASMS